MSADSGERGQVDVEGSRALRQVAETTTTYADAVRLVAARALNAMHRGSEDRAVLRTIPDAIEALWAVGARRKARELGERLLASFDGKHPAPEVHLLGQRIALFWPVGPKGAVLLMIGATSIDFCTLTEDFEVCVAREHISFWGVLDAEVAKYLPSGRKQDE